MRPQPDIGKVLHESRRLQGQLVNRMITPVDAIFDLFADSAKTLRQQAEALEQAGRALERSAALMKHQAELFDSAVGTLRYPADIARVVGGAPKRHNGGET